ncbi:DUF3052 domain-containing protein [Phycicoccus endophyticus]|uniref:DUF3052 domain-containing protein n=1 Tax=Phycicoccus endophyticus TaxID=1690220 RepID=A0A7G9R401_9MICO|nr:DUF3052 domain-containing protein [Phycicoccus endophyticus]NHI18165.1 DUF3052 domain-containing protein [Phycicoccus endophyticus]QNN50326.1 DUF3052 domain-containing protein [Phycicoccus endophyticus]GGL25956.1 hypothetical protein GCM10012283_05130 [Phycicoccus endophyticus]
MNTPTPPPVDPGSTVPGAVERLGFAHDQVVQEFGYDSDVDEAFREAVESACGAPTEDEEYTGAADAVLLWFRAEDGDLGDALVDMVGVLDEGGFVVLLTPRADEEVDPSEIDEAAVTAGLHLAGTFNASPQWRAHKLVSPRGNGRR